MGAPSISWRRRLPRGRLTAGVLERFAIVLFLLAAVFLVGGLVMDAQLKQNKHNVGALRLQVKKIKSSLFANKMGEIEAGAEQEAKLTKILSLMEDHLGHDLSDAEAMNAFSLSFGNAAKQHKRLLKKELKTLGGNEKVRQYLEKQLTSAVNSFYGRVSEKLRDFEGHNLKEGREASWRLKEVVDSFRKDLKSEIQEEKREVLTETTIEQRDADWKKMARTYRKKAQKETQDEKDEEAMISNFQENLNAAKELLLTQADLNEANQLHELGLKLLELKSDPDNKLRPRNQVHASIFLPSSLLVLNELRRASLLQEAIRDKMKSMMKTTIRLQSF